MYALKPAHTQIKCNINLFALGTTDLFIMLFCRYKISSAALAHCGGFTSASHHYWNCRHCGGCSLEIQKVLAYAILQIFTPTLVLQGNNFKL